MRRHDPVTDPQGNLAVKECEVATSRAVRARGARRRRGGTEGPASARGTPNRLRLALQCLRRQVEANAREIEKLQLRDRDDRDVLDMAGCAALLGVSLRTLKRRVRERKIPFVRLGGDKNVRFIKADILAWLRRGAPASRRPRLGDPGAVDAAQHRGGPRR